VKAIFNTSIELHQKKLDEAKKVIFDTTVQKKTSQFQPEQN
jgi:hypothetical protein